MQFKARQIFDGNDFLGGGTVHLEGKGIRALDTTGSPGGAGLVMPGFIDSHVHLLGVGISLQELRLNNCQSREDFALALREYAASYPGRRIMGRGWDQNKQGFTPDRHFLDEICNNRPIILTRTCGHVVAANSMALELAGIDRNCHGVPGGVIMRDAAGEPTGILEEKATALVFKNVPAAEPALLYSALEKAIKYAHSCGITGIQTDDRGAVGEYQDLWELYTKVTESNPIRAQLHYNINSVEALRNFIRIKKELKDTRFIYAGAAKLFLDGSLGARTAALLEDYSDDPGNKGVLVYPDSLVKEIISLAEENGIQMGMHVIGDAALEQALRVLAEVRGGYSKGPVMHRMIHCQVTNKSQLGRMAALGMMAEIQPGFLRTDMHWAGSRLGDERLQTSYCWRTMADAGIFMTGGSDSPVEDINPWPGVHAAVTRRDGAGNYADAWAKDESLSLEEALHIYTAAPALLAGWDKLGSIQAGKTADLAVYTEFDREDLAVNKPNQVMVNGIIVYQR